MYPGKFTTLVYESVLIVFRSLLVSALANSILSVVWYYVSPIHLEVLTRALCNVVLIREEISGVVLTPPCGTIDLAA